MSDTVHVLPEFDADIVCEDTRELPREQWLELRRSGLGGSDAPATLGLSPYTSPVALYLDKVDPQPDVDKPIFEAGRRAEPTIALWFAEHTGYQVVHYPVMLRSRRHSFMLGNVDRFVVNDDGEWCVLEIKNVDRSKAHEWVGGPPLYARLQGLHYLSVCGDAFAKLYVAACIGGNDYRYFEIERDEELITNLIAKEEEFWTLVQLERMPEVDGSDSTRDALRAHFSAEEGSIVKVDEKFTSLIQRRKVQKAAIALEAQRLNEIESEMLVLMGEAEIATCNGVVIATYKTINKKSYVVKESSYRQWNVPKPKENNE
jgi:putative phage-type endonuclease